MGEDYDYWAKERGVDMLPLKESPHAQRITMDEYGLKLAEVVSLRAACTRRQVGAVIIDENKRILATGYNGSPAGALHCSDGGCPRGAFTHQEIPGFLGNAGHEVKCIALHAEQNAIDWVLMNHPAPELALPTSTIYITCQPCPDCESLATQYGLRIVWPW